MKKQQNKSGENAHGPSKPGAGPARAPAHERPSLPGERAEGEGMIASGPAPAKGKAPAASELEGEGSYSAARRYDEGVQRSVKKGDVEKLAEEAAKALDGPEGKVLRDAEQAAKHGPR
jgi:hypothetical protein